MDTGAKNQVIERIKQANNVLVTVSTNPSVDQLAACIGLTLLLNRMQKHATAVFSGQVPSTLEFLQPEKTIETNTDSLRDFIISLDKDKADKLRYKVEDQVVRIFITPYKTSIGEKDLVFSQGDFNVEVVVALGVKDRSQIDAAITSHGRILHDATVISLNAGQGTAPALGQINWQDPAASSLSEMIVSLSEAFGSGLIDNQMSTAFLTGIVAETGRFANTKTSPRTMTISAQLMAAGANQQLIVSKLQPEVQAPVRRQQPVAPKELAAKLAAPETEVDDGTLKVDHNNGAKKTLPKLHSTPRIGPDEIHIDEQGNLRTAASLRRPINEEPPLPPPTQEPSNPPTPPTPPPTPPSSPPPSPAPPPPPKAPTPTPPTSSSSEAPKIVVDKRVEESGPHAFLNPLNSPPILNSTFTAGAEPEQDNDYNSMAVDPLSGGPAQPTLLEHKGNVESTAENARDAVEKAYDSAPFDPATAPPVQALNAQPVDLAKQPKEDENKQDSAAAPPFPPPLSPTQGVVIPTPPASTTAA